MRTVKLTKETTRGILENLLKRSPQSYGTYESAVHEILEQVHKEGDSAVFAYTKSLTAPRSTKTVSG